MATWDINVSGTIGSGAAANGEVATADGAGGVTWEALNIPTLAANTNVVYVSRVGNDANSGLTIALPKLTINAALTAANALAPNPAAVYVVDAGEYTEDLNLGGTPVIAPTATLVGRAILSANAMLVVKNHYPAVDGSIAVDAGNANGYAYYICTDKIDARGKAGTFTACDAVRNIYNGMVLHVKCPVIIGSQTAVYATNNITGHIHLDVSDIYVTGTSKVGISATDNVGVGGRIYGKVDHIINLSGATSSTAILLTGTNSVVSITANEINTDAAYTVPLGSLYLVCPRILGTRTGTPVFEVSTHNVTGTQPLDADLTAIAGLTPANDDILQRKSGSWVNRTLSQFRSDLMTAVGRAVSQLATPVDKGWIRVNADGTVQNRTDAEARDDLSLGTAALADSTDFDAAGSAAAAQAAAIAASQPVDADLTAIAGLSTNGLVERTGAGTAAIRAIGVGAGSSVPTRDDADARYITPFAYSLLPAWTVGTQATTAVTLTDVTNTELTVPGAGMYEFEYRVTYNANAVGTGAGFTARNTVGGTADYAAIETGVDAGAGDRSTFRGGFSLDVVSSTSRVTTGNQAIVRGRVIFNAASAIRLQFRTETVTTTTITVTDVIGFIRRVA
jgi:hypothetical protein